MQIHEQEVSAGVVTWLGVGGYLTANQPRQPGPAESSPRVTGPVVYPSWTMTAMRNVRQVGPAWAVMTQVRASSAATSRSGSMTAL